MHTSMHSYFGTIVNPDLIEPTLEPATLISLYRLCINLKHSSTFGGRFLYK